MSRALHEEVYRGEWLIWNNPTPRPDTAICYLWDGYTGDPRDESYGYAANREAAKRDINRRFYPLSGRADT